MIDAAAEDGRPGLHARHAGGRQRLPPVRQQRRRRHAAVVDGQTLPAGTLYIPMDQGMKHWIQAAPGREPVHPVRLLLRRRDLELPAPARPRRLRLPDGADVPRRPDDRAHLGTPSFGTRAERRQRRSTRSTRTRRAASRSRSTCSTRASTSTASRRASPPAASSSTRARRSSTARRWPPAASTSPTLATKRQTPVERPVQLPGRRASSWPSRRSASTPARRRSRRTRCSRRARTSTAPAPLPALKRRRQSFCEALHSLAVKLEVPLSTLIPVTSTDLTNGNLVTQGFTALINPGSTIATTTTGHPAGHDADARTNLLAFINGGGTYVGTNAGGVDLGPHDRGDDAQHHVDHGPADAGLDVRRLVRHDQPGGLGLRPRRLDLP